MIILPRQARDKHIGKTQKEMPFPTGDGDTVGLLIDLSTKTLSVYKNGDCVAALIHTGLTGPVCFMAELCMGKEINASFAMPFDTKTDHFAKTGSGQT